MIRTLVLTLLAASLASAADPFSGTWVLEPGQSKFSNGEGLAEATMTWTVEGDAVRVTTIGRRASGAPFRESYVAFYDGKERSSKGPWNFDAVINRITGEREREAVFKREGKVVGTQRFSISPDGKRLTSMLTFGGESSTRVYSRR
jgi:hypothetical protein